MWLPIPPDEIEGLPEGPAHRYWNGEEDFPADPADCAFYVVPYMKPSGIGIRPLPDMRARPGRPDALRRHRPRGARAGAPARRRTAVQRARRARGQHRELTLALILASLRGVPDFVRAQDRGEWLGGFRPALADRKVLIVGYGPIGAAIEDRLAPFEVAPVVRVARSARTTARGPVHPLTELPALLPEADVVVISTPLTEATRGLANADFLARMKDGALLVNVARGPVVDTKALLAELESGRLTAALDVTDPEPLPPGHPCGMLPA